MPEAEYLDLGFPDQADPTTKLERALAALSDATGWNPQDGDPLRVTLEAAAELAADNETVAQTVARAVFRRMGVSLVGLAAREALPATAHIVITATADTGGTIESGVTEVSIDSVGFVATEDATIAAGGSANVAFSALVAGADGNALTGVPDPITALAWVQDWTLTTPTDGGQDAETASEYETRLARRMRSIGRPIIAVDFSERMAENTEVYRTLVLDGYNPDTATDGNDATVTLVSVDADGEPISTTAKTERLAALEAEREVGWNIFIEDADYTTVNVAATITIWPGYDSATVVTATEAAITDALSPAKYGSTPTGELPDWNLEPVLYRSELVTVINNVEGVRHVVNDTLLLNGSDADVTLTGVAPLTRPGTIAVTAA